ncbi:MAG: hypothetical protein ACOVJ5_00425 [Gloeomargaritales cyanobacterium]
MDRQEGYYWVKYEGIFQIAKYEIHQKLSGTSTNWYLSGLENCFIDSDFEHINEVRIKMPGELPD